MTQESALQYTEYVPHGPRADGWIPVIVTTDPATRGMKYHVIGEVRVTTENVAEDTNERLKEVGTAHGADGIILRWGPSAVHSYMTPGYTTHTQITSTKREAANFYGANGQYTGKVEYDAPTSTDVPLYHMGDRRTFTTPTLIATFIVTDGVENH